MEDLALYDLFLNKEYELQAFDYKGIQEQIKCLKSNSTDFDLTGQIIWEAAIQLAKFIIDNQEDYKDKVILEIGAGAGLSGIICANFAKQVILTDNNEIVVELLELNKEYQLNKEFQKKDNLIVKYFEWGEEQAKKLITETGKVDHIIGSDILLWPASIKPLAQTFRVYLDTNPECKIIISIQERSQYTVNSFDSEIKKLNIKKSLIKNIGPVLIYSIESTQ